MCHPRGLCQDASGNIYVADHGSDSVLVLGRDLVFKKEFKCQSGAKGVAIDSRGTLHVATTSGLESFPGKLASSSKSGSLGDVAVSQEGYRFVTFVVDGRLEKCKPDESLLGTIDGLRSPLGVFLDQSGYVYVAENGANRVCKY